MRAKIFATWVVFFILGTLTASLFGLNIIVWLSLACGLMFCSFLIFGNRLSWAIVFGFGCFFLAIFLFQKQADLYKKLNQIMTGKRTVNGTVYDIPTETEKGVQARILTNTGVVMAYLKNYPSIKYGDKLDLIGTVEEFEQDKINYLIKEKIIGEMTVKDFKVIGVDDAWGIKARGALFWLRNRLNESIKRSLPKEEAGLASGLILGEKALISAELKRNLQASGTTHIIALSGYNITIILGLFAFLKTKASRLMNLVVPTIFILSFVVMTGAAASIVRAAIMGFMPILARFLGRPANSVIAVLTSAFLMLIFNPYLALYDIGFQLSFMAMVGLIYFAPLVSNLFGKENYFVEVLSQTLSAQIAVLPILIYNFGVISVISPLSNLAILSLVPAGMFLAFLVGVTGMISPLLAKFAALVAFPLLQLFNQLIGFFGSLPFASFQFKLNNIFWVITMYFLIFDCAFLIKNGRARIISGKKGQVYTKTKQSKLYN